MEPEDTPPAHPPVGSVAQETARLLEALLGAPTPSPKDRLDDPPDVDEGAEPTPRGGDAGACPTCGHTDVGTGAAGHGDDAAVCRVCPVCQVLRVVRSVRPETLDRLADLAAAVTETLRDAAAHRWGETDRGDVPGPGPGRQTTRSAPVQDIRVVDDDGTPDDLDESDEVLDEAKERR